jgi:hypothetical protein
MMVIFWLEVVNNKIDAIEVVIVCCIWKRWRGFFYLFYIFSLELVHRRRRSQPLRVRLLGICVRWHQTRHHRYNHK